MKLADFLIQEEGSDSRKLSDGRFASTWDPLGHVFNIGPGITHGVTKDTVWTQDQLDAAEAKEFADVEACVARSVLVPISQNARVACESLAYNIGDAGFEHSSVLREINAGHMAAATRDFRLWNKAGGKVCQGLVNRREAEIKLFLHPDDVPVPADLRAVKTPLTATMETAPMNPTVTVPAAASNVVVNPWYSTILNIVSIAGGIVASNHIDVGGLIATLSGGSFWGGLLAIVVPQVINHLTQKNSNAVTISALFPSGGGGLLNANRTACAPKHGRQVLSSCRIIAKVIPSHKGRPHDDNC